MTPCSPDPIGLPAAFPPARPEPRIKPVPPCGDRAPLPFDRFLERLNKEERAALPRTRPHRSTPADPSPGAPRRPDSPRLGDLTPVIPTVVEHRLRVHYRIEVPIPLGHMIDLFA